MKTLLTHFLIALTLGLSGVAFCAELKPGMGYTKLKLPDVCPTYLVRKGDTVGSIAKKFTVTVAELMRVNSIKDAKALKTGQKLLIPKSVRLKVKVAASERSYRCGARAHCHAQSIDCHAVVVYDKTST